MPDISDLIELLALTLGGIQIGFWVKSPLSPSASVLATKYDNKATAPVAFGGMEGISNELRWLLTLSNPITNFWVSVSMVIATTMDIHFRLNNTITMFIILRVCINDADHEDARGWECDRLAISIIQSLIRMHVKLKDLNSNNVSEKWGRPGHDWTETRMAMRACVSLHATWQTWHETRLDISQYMDANAMGCGERLVGCEHAIFQTHWKQEKGFSSICHPFGPGWVREWERF